VTIAELIEELQKKDPNLKVCRIDSEYGYEEIEQIYTDNEYATLTYLNGVLAGNPIVLVIS
jgi:hypothetical protein